MLEPGKALKVSIYLSEGAMYHGFAAEAAILDFLFYRGVSGATVLRGMAGFGGGHHLHSASSVEISDRLPIKVEFIETETKMDELMAKLEEMAGSGLIEVQETRGVTPARSTTSKATAPVQPVAQLQGKAKQMQIYIGEDDRWNDKPLHQALVEALRANDLAGATVYRGVVGFGAHRRVHRDKPFHLSHDASIMISVIDTEEKLNGCRPVLEQMVQEGMVVMCDVEVVTYRHRPLE